MKSYSEKLKVIKKYEKIFAEEGFILPYIDLVIRKAWLDVWDSYHLFCHAKRIPNHGTFLEIGTWHGGSVLCAFLATQAVRTSVNFTTVDIGIDEKTKSEVFSLIPDIQFILARSDVAKYKIQNNSIDLCFLDGAHHYAQVKRDILNYWPKIKIGGVLLGHDYSRQKVHRGVVKATKEIFGKRFIRLKNSRVFRVMKIAKGKLK